MPIGDLAPELAVLLGGVACLLLATFLPQRRQASVAWVALAGLGVAAGLALLQADAERLTFSGTFALDGGTTAARLIILAASALCVALSPRWFATDRRHGEYYAMILLSVLGALAMAGAADLMQLLMGVLLSSVTGYVLAAYHRDWAISLEAGMKYFLVGALANALMVLGVVLIMGTMGTTAYGALAGRTPSGPLALTGLALTSLGLLFKLGAVPAQAWVPDVAEGAPAPSAAFLTVVPKVAAAVALYRLVALVPAEGTELRLLMAIAAAATMTLGNLAALRQDDVRRLIGWSSVSQAGYALMAVAVAGSAGAPGALMLFLAAYAAANLTAFAVVTHLRGRTALSDYAGLLSRRPDMAAILTLAFLSMVGIPPLAGFGGKLGLFSVTLANGLGWLTLVGLANSALSLAYYLRVAGRMTFAEPGEAVSTLGPATAVVAWSGAFVTLALLLIAPMFSGPIDMLP